VEVSTRPLRSGSSVKQTLFGIGVWMCLSMLVSCSLLGRDPDPPPPGIVQLGASGFTLNDSSFYPMALNYIVGPRWQNGELWFGPSADYRRERKDHFCPKMVAHERLRGDVELVREMGFNSIRIVGICDEVGFIEPKDSLGIKVPLDLEHDTLLLFSDPVVMEQYLSALNEVFDICAEQGLKVIPLTTIHLDAPENETFLSGYLDHFSTNSSILAFDLFNEPLYFDRPERPKAVVMDVVHGWRMLKNEHAPNHLFTIGLTGIREVFEFDPDILDVDFISFHPYEYEPDQVRNEIAWYGKHIRTPWIIGETAIPADNDSIAYDKQKAFAERTLEQALACGAKGYSWWQFKDVAWNYFHADHMGLLSRSDSTVTRSGRIVEGSMKSTVEAFRNFNPRNVPPEPADLPNYFNYSQHGAYRIVGKLVNEDGGAVEDGVMLGWNEYWTSSYHTVTRTDGTFELLSDFPIHHWMVSSVRRSMERGDVPMLEYRDEDGLKTFDLGTITLRELDVFLRLRERSEWRLKQLTGKQ